MAVDTPARIAVLGAGPIGLEAALYARFLGYDVDVYEQGEVAEHIRDWGHVQMFSPFGMNRSALGLAALSAQSTRWQRPADDACLTGHEFREQYLLPLAGSDLISDQIHTGTRVLGVSRDGPLKGDLLGDEERGDWLFRLLLADREGRERIATADVVLDTTGTYSQPAALGSGGLPAPGERAARECIAYGLPDVLGATRSRYAGRRTAVIGSGYSAATTIVALSQLAAQAPGTEVVWIYRHQREAPLARIENDRLPLRDQLAQSANELAAQPPAWLQVHRDTMVEEVSSSDPSGPVALRLAGETNVEVDQIVAHVGFKPDLEMIRELQFHPCYASEGPIKLAAGLLAQTSADCLDQPSLGPQALLTPEPHFYVLGSKSYGRSSQFLLATGLTQIRDVFSIIGDRADLDLYANVGSGSLGK